MRLVPGPTRGRVEVKNQDQWGTVCDDNFDMTDARVVCRMLGYNLATTSYTAPAGTGKIWLNDLKCVGRETNVFDCPHSGLGVHNCVHSEDVGVKCA